jgi:gamma-glutamylputrescine oxidase
MLSYWEKEYMVKNIDFAVVGSGIVGLSTALELRSKHPSARIAVFERGGLPWGASTKNAGFACFGSPSELLSDLRTMNESEVQALLEMRYLGLTKLLERCGKEAIDYYNWGSNELFSPSQTESFNQCNDSLEYLNNLVFPIVKKNVYSINDAAIKEFGFKGIQHLIKNEGEGQLNTGKMMNTLLRLANENNILIYNGMYLENYQEDDHSVNLYFSGNITLKSSYLCVTTNGFARQLLPDLEVDPARAQVLITEPIVNLRIKGTFHFDEGYFYFRNIDNRILLGGGRNLDFEGEKTSEISTTQLIQNRLTQLLKEVILPNEEHSIAYSWAGVMGVGMDKNPIIKQLSTRVFCGVKMGGMGVAIGSIIGEKLAKIMS